MVVNSAILVISHSKVGVDVSVVIPCYNEATTVAQLIHRVLALSPEPWSFEVIVVDDGSTDGTEAVLAKLQHPALTIVRHPRNLGKGAALRTGICRAQGRVVVFQDADLEYFPADIPELVSPILSGETDVVFGSRFATQRALQMKPLWHTLGNRALTTLSNRCSGWAFTDISCGYKAFRHDVLWRLKLEENGFGVEAELTAKLAQLGPRVSVREVPTQYAPRTRAAGKKIRFKDGLVAIRCVLQYSGVLHRLPFTPREGWPSSVSQAQTRVFARAPSAAQPGRCAAGSSASSAGLDCSVSDSHGSPVQASADTG